MLKKFLSSNFLAKLVLALPVIVAVLREFPPVN